MSASFNLNSPIEILQGSFLAIVTGGGSGMGLAFARHLAEAGYNLGLIESNRESAKAAEEMIHKDFPQCRVFVVVGDITEAGTWNELTSAIEDQPIKLLVNNAGILHAGLICQSDPEDLRRVVEVNLIGTMLGCSTIVPRLVKSAGNASFPADPPSGVINVASIFASISPPGFSAYNASKAGIIGLSETLLGELKPKGHHVTVILPGVVPTRLFDNGSYSKESYRKQVTDYLVNAELTAEGVVSQALEAFGKRRFEVPIGKKASWYWRLKRWIPLTLLDRVAKKSREQLK